MLHRWFHAPHARRWFAARGATVADVTEEYGLDGSVPIHVYIVSMDGVPIGMVQWLRFGDFDWLMKDYDVTDPQAVNCDVLIGEPAATHRGLGPPMILRFLREIVFEDPTLTTCIIDPEVENAIAIRVYEKAGFRFVREVNDDRGAAVHRMELGRAALMSR